MSRESRSRLSSASGGATVPSIFCGGPWRPCAAPDNPASNNTERIQANGFARTVPSIRARTLCPFLKYRHFHSEEQCQRDGTPPQWAAALLCGTALVRHRFWVAQRFRVPHRFFGGTALGALSLGR